MMIWITFIMGRVMSALTEVCAH